MGLNIENAARAVRGRRQAEGATWGNTRNSLDANTRTSDCSYGLAKAKGGGANAEMGPISVARGARRRSHGRGPWTVPDLGPACLRIAILGGAPAKPGRSPFCRRLRGSATKESGGTSYPPRVAIMCAIHRSSLTIAAKLPSHGADCGTKC